MTTALHFPSYVPATLKEHYFSDVPAPTAGDDGRALTYDHGLAGYVYTSFDAAGLAAAAASGAATALATHAGVTSGVHGIAAFGATLNATANQSAAQTALGLVIGTNVQAQNANLAAIAGLTTAANKLEYWTSAGVAALADFTSYGRGLVASANVAATGLLAADGSVTGATGGAQTFANSIIATAGIRPQSDTTSYNFFTKADGTTGIIYGDTTNRRIGINVVSPSATLEINGVPDNVPCLKMTSQVNSDVIQIVKAGIGNIAALTLTSPTSSGFLLTNTSTATYLANGFNYGYSAIISHSVDNYGLIAINGSASQTRVSAGSNADLAIGVSATASSSIATAGVWGYAVKAAASTKNVTPVWARTGPSATDADAAAIDVVNSSNTRQFGITPTGRIMTNQATANANTPSGATAKKLEIFDTAGASLGFIPIYASAW